MRKLPGAELAVIPRIEHGVRRLTNGILIHDMESDNLLGVEHYFATSSPDGVGAHIGIGRYGRTRQWADLDAICYHAPGDNADKVGIEACGFASLSKRQWIRRYKERRAQARAIAHLCIIYHLGEPIHMKNVFTHADSSKIHGVPGGHTDPGPNYPIHATLKTARKFYKKWSK